MSARSESLQARDGRPVTAVGLDRRLARAVVATLVIGGYMALGFAFGLNAEAYLLLGIPITIAFQVLVVRRPLRSLWLRDAPPMMWTTRSALAVVVVAIAPALVAAHGARDGNLAIIGWGLAAMVGAVPARHFAEIVGWGPLYAHPGRPCEQSRGWPRWPPPTLSLRSGRQRQAGRPPGPVVERRGSR